MVPPEKIARLAIGALLGLWLGCAAPQNVDPRIGRQLPEVGLVVNVGIADGQEWIVGISLDQNLVCTSLFVANKPQETSCSGRDVAGRNDLVVSIANGRPNLVNGFANDNVAWVEATGNNGPIIAPAVPLHLLGLPGRAFGLFVPLEAELRQLNFMDASGKIVERRTLPTITVNSAGGVRLETSLATVEVVPVPVEGRANLLAFAAGFADDTTIDVVIALDVARTEIARLPGFPH